MQAIINAAIVMMMVIETWREDRTRAPEDLAPAKSVEDEGHRPPAIESEKSF
jgi:hypothetical protein